MANFIPLKNYMFYCLDRLIERYGLGPPFLDVGCGIGDLSVYVAGKGWDGKAIDISDEAVQISKKNLIRYSKVEVEKKSLFAAGGKYRTILLWDIIEHLENDEKALKKMASLLYPGGYVLIAVPSNPREWRWDDDFYGHWRRYTTEEIEDKVKKAGLEPVVSWDFTYPVFWAMRRVYLKLKPRPDIIRGNNEERTIASATANAWEVTGISRLLNRECFLWRLVYHVQFACFRNRLEEGWALFALARKPELS